MNAGEPFMLSPQAAAGRVLGIQRKLHKWASDDQDRGFSDNLVCDPATLLVRGDGCVAIESHARPGSMGRPPMRSRRGWVWDGSWTSSGRSFAPAPFRPVAVKERVIPKRTGKLRYLGIPTIRDRVVQAALKLVLEPIFEVDFEPCSYGFRPGRRTQDALAEIQHFTFRSYEWVVEGDIEACFDSVRWDLVLKAVAHHEACFDSVRWDLVLKAVAHHTDQRWILLYVERWLKARAKDPHRVLQGRRPARLA